MKKHIFALIFTILVTFSVLKAQTTQEEYNYITKGYKVQIEAGLDMKKGYTLIDMGEWGTNYVAANTEIRRCTFKGLIRNGQTKPCAIMMIYQRRDIPTGSVFYVCIPSIDAPEEIWKQTLDFVSTNFKDQNNMVQTIIFSLMKLASSQAAN